MYGDLWETQSLTALLSQMLPGRRARMEPPPDDDAPWFDNFGARPSRLSTWRKSLTRPRPESAGGSSPSSSERSGEPGSPPTIAVRRRHWPRSSSSAVRPCDSTTPTSPRRPPSGHVFGCFGAGMGERSLVDPAVPLVPAAAAQK